MSVCLFLGNAGITKSRWGRSKSCWRQSSVSHWYALVSRFVFDFYD